MNDDYTGMRAMPKDFPLKFVEKTDAEKLAELKKALKESTLREFEYQKRIKELEFLTRWIPVGERLPTEEDGDEAGYVLWWRDDLIHLPLSAEFDLHRQYNLNVADSGFTHWRRIDKP